MSDKELVDEAKRRGAFTSNAEANRIKEKLDSGKADSTWEIIKASFFGVGPSWKR